MPGAEPASTEAQAQMGPLAHVLPSLLLVDAAGQPGGDLQGPYPAPHHIHRSQAQRCLPG